jgi:hypothetical protein
MYEKTDLANKISMALRVNVNRQKPAEGTLVETKYEKKM